MLIFALCGNPPLFLSQPQLTTYAATWGWDFHKSQKAKQIQYVAGGDRVSFCVCSPMPYAPSCDAPFCVGAHTHPYTPKGGMGVWVGPNKISKPNWCDMMEKTKRQKNVEQLEEIIKSVGRITPTDKVLREEFYSRREGLSARTKRDQFARAVADLKKLGRLEGHGKDRHGRIRYRVVTTKPKTTSPKTTARKAKQSRAKKPKAKRARPESPAGEGWHKHSLDDGWALYVRPGQDWSSFKLVNPDSKARKRNYWAGYSRTQQRFSRVRDMELLEQHHPQVFDALLWALAEVLPEHIDSPPPQ